MQDIMKEFYPLKRIPIISHDFIPILLEIMHALKKTLHRKRHRLCKLHKFLHCSVHF